MKLRISKSAEICPMEEHITKEWTRDFISEHIIGGTITQAFQEASGMLAINIDNSVILRFGHVKECCENITLRSSQTNLDELLGKTVSSIAGTVKYHYMNEYAVSRNNSIFGSNSYWRAISIGLNGGGRVNIPWACQIGMCGSSSLKMFVDTGNARKSLGMWQKGQLLKTWLDHGIVRNGSHTWYSDIDVVPGVEFGM